MLLQFAGLFTKIEISVTNRLATIEVAMPDASTYPEAFGISIK
jgi:hypothetical protein